ncbi:60S ribosomal protein L31 [Candidatus Micrarchaeota archaeon]|nr:60S ribosomal protein L31 [Candidatus Micrarchaeota archaeon]
MADERFQDKALAKKDEAKIKGEATDEKANPHEHKADAQKAESAAPIAKAAGKASEKAKTEKAAAEKGQKTEKAATKSDDKADSKDEKPARKTVLERKYTVNLTDAYAKPKYKRADKAISLLREFALRHMKGKDVKVDVALNNAIRTSNRPQKKVHILLQKDEAGTVFAALVPKA